MLRVCLGQKVLAARLDSLLQVFWEISKKETNIQLNLAHAPAVKIQKIVTYAQAISHQNQ